MSPALRGVRAVARRRLADQRRSVLLWGASLGVLDAFMAAIYPSIQDSLAAIADRYPAGLKEAFGVEDLTSVEAYVHTEMFSLIVPLSLAFFAVHSVSAAIVGAEERGELDTLLSLPLGRRAFAAGAVVAALAASGAVLAITGVLTLVGARIAGTGMSVGLTAAGVLGVWALAVLAGGIAALACGALHRARAVTGIAMGVIVAMYAVDIAGRLSDPLEPLRYVSAFRYYGAPLRDGLDVSGFLVLLAAGAVLATAGAAFFERRDLGR